MIANLLAATSNSSNNSNPLFTLFFFGAIFGAMYFLLLRPQRKRVKESAALQSSIVEGDEVVLNSGIFGFVSALEGDIVWLDIADGHGSERIEIRVSRGAIARKVTATTPNTDSK